MEIVIEETSKGGRILQDLDSGKYRVQPYDGDYWIEVDTLAQAREAYHNPDQYPRLRE